MRRATALDEHYLRESKVSLRTFLSRHETGHAIVAFGAGMRSVVCFDGRKIARSLKEGMSEFGGYV